MSPAWLSGVLRPLLEVNLAAAAGIVLVLILRRPVLRAFGARAAYGLWLAPLLAAAAVLIPARIAPASASLPPASPEAVLDLTRAAAPAAIHFERDLAVWIWLAGALIGLVWLAVSHLRFLAAERAGRAGPAVAGLLAPRIVLPSDFESRFEPAERAAILAHERAHLRGQDSRINAFAAVLACLAWFNPLVQLAGRRMRLDQDLACDETALAQRPGQARLYAATLLKAQMQTAGSPAACAFGAHPLAERIAQAARARPGRARRLAGMVLALAFGLGGAVAAWAAQPARPAPLTSPARASVIDAPTPREGEPVPDASRNPAARQLLAEAVPPSPEGETMITTSLAPRRLAAATVLALGLGTGSVQAAVTQPTPPVDYVAAPASAKVAVAPKGGSQSAPFVKYAQASPASKAERPIPALKAMPAAPVVKYASAAPAKVAPPPPPPPVMTPREVPPPPRPPLPPREVPPPPIPYGPGASGDAGAAVATLVMIDGRRLTCTPGSSQCIEALAAAMKDSAQARAQADMARLQAQAAASDAQRQALDARAAAQAASDAERQARTQAQIDAARRAQGQ